MSPLKSRDMSKAALGSEQKPKPAEGPPQKFGPINPQRGDSVYIQIKEAGLSDIQPINSHAPTGGVGFLVEEPQLKVASPAPAPSRD